MVARQNLTTLNTEGTLYCRIACMGFHYGAKMICKYDMVSLRNLDSLKEDHLGYMMIQMCRDRYIIYTFSNESDRDLMVELLIDASIEVVKPSDFKRITSDLYSEIRQGDYRNCPDDMSSDFVVQIIRHLEESGVK